MKAKKLNLLRMLKDAVVYSWKAGPWIFLSLVFSSILKCFMQLAEIYLLRNLFLEVTNFVNKMSSIHDVIIATVELGITLLFSQGVELWEYLSQGYFWRRGNGYLQSLFHMKLSRTKVLDFEDYYFLNTIKKSTLGSEDAPDAIRSILQVIFYYIPFFTLTTWYLYQLLPVMVFALAIISLSVLCSEWIKAVRTYDFVEKISELNRKIEYYEDCVTAREYFKETRFLGIVKYFLKCYDFSIDQYQREYSLKEKTNLKSNLLMNAINVFGYILVFCLLTFYMKSGAINVLEFATVYFAIDKVKNALEDMTKNIGAVLQSVARMSFLFDFLRNKDICKKKDLVSKNKGIMLKNVSFSYPSMKKNVLENINLIVKPGETVAIVGDNGAGKSTLVKILIGLYQPTDGAVYYGEKMAYDFENFRIYENISGIFQDFNKYKLSLQENIRISDLSNRQDIKCVLSKVGFDFNKLPDKEYTILGKEFGGTELSGGEWQRIAIARGLYRKSDIIVLDEPTAAIDPIEETKIYHKFARISEGKTSIIVTHRIGAAQIADLIVVLKDGKLDDIGTHQELMQKDGLYAVMYQEQAKWYKNRKQGTIDILF